MLDFAVKAPYSIDVEALGINSLMPVPYTYVHHEEYSYPVYDSNILISVGQTRKEIEIWRDKIGYGGFIFDLVLDKGGRVTRDSMLRTMELLEPFHGKPEAYTDMSTETKELYLEPLCDLTALNTGTRGHYTIVEDCLHDNGHVVHVQVGSERALGYYSYRLAKPGSIRNPVLNKFYRASGRKPNVIVLKEWFSLLQHGIYHTFECLKNADKPILITVGAEREEQWFRSIGFHKLSRRKGDRVTSMQWVPSAGKRKQSYVNAPLCIYS